MLVRIGVKQENSIALTMHQKHRFFYYTPYTKPTATTTKMNKLKSVRNFLNLFNNDNPLLGEIGSLRRQILRLMRFALMLCLFFLFLSMSCDTQVKEKSVLEGREKRLLSPHWIMQLPYGAEIDSTHSESLAEPSTVVFGGDSLMIKYHYSDGIIWGDIDCAYEERKRLVRGLAQDGIYAKDDARVDKYEAFIDPTTRLTGLLIYRNDHGRKSVSLVISECSMGQLLQLTFESVGAQHRDFITETLHSLEFVR